LIKGPPDNEAVGAFQDGRYQSPFTFRDCRPILQRKDISMEYGTERVRYPGQYGSREHYNRIVFICSPYRPEAEEPEEKADELLRNIHLARLGCKTAVRRGCTPIAPHLIFPQFLKDEKPEDREAGMKMGVQLLLLCDEVWVLGRRISEGMGNEIAIATEEGIPIFILENPASSEERLLKAIFGAKAHDEG